MGERSLTQGRNMWNGRGKRRPGCGRAMRGVAGDTGRGPCGLEESMSEGPDMRYPAFRLVATGLCSFECGKRFNPLALSFGGLPEITLSLKAQPEVGVGVEGLR